MGRNLPMHQKRIVGSYYGGGVPERDFERVYAAYRAGRLPLDRLVGETVPLEAVNDALRALEAGVDTRTVVVF